MEDSKQKAQYKRAIGQIDVAQRPDQSLPFYQHTLERNTLVEPSTFKDKNDTNTVTTEKSKNEPTNGYRIIPIIQDENHNQRLSQDTNRNVIYSRKVHIPTSAETSPYHLSTYTHKSTGKKTNPFHQQVPSAIVLPNTEDDRYQYVGSL